MPCFSPIQLKMSGDACRYRVTIDKMKLCSRYSSAGIITNKNPTEVGFEGQESGWILALMPLFVILFTMLVTVHMAVSAISVQFTAVFPAILFGFV